MCKKGPSLVLNCWQSGHVHPQYLYSFSFFKLSVGVDTWWVTWKLCLQKKKWRQRPQHQGTLEKCFHKPIWRFLCFRMPTFPPQPSQKKICFFFLLSFLFIFLKFPLYYGQIEYVHWILWMEMDLQSSAPALWKRKKTLAASLFTYWIQMKNSASFGQKCSKNVIKHFSAGNHLRFNAEPLKRNAGTLIEEHLLVSI